MHEHPASVVAHRTGMSKTTSMLQRAATVGSRLSSHRLHPRETAGPAHQDVDHLVNGLQLGNHYGLQKNLDRGKEPLRHERDVDDMSLHTTGVRTTLSTHVFSMCCNCGITTVIFTTSTCETRATGTTCKIGASTTRPRAPGESLWSARPCGSASVSRQKCQRPARPDKPATCTTRSSNHLVDERLGNQKGPQTHSGPWEKAIAPPQGCKSPVHNRDHLATNCNWGVSMIC